MLRASPVEITTNLLCLRITGQTLGALAASDSLVFKESAFFWHLHSLKLFKMVNYIQDFASEQ